MMHPSRNDEEKTMRRNRRQLLQAGLAASAGVVAGCATVAQPTRSPW
jgi:hypothetical protein